jgi:hypothetical protein
MENSSFFLAFLLTMVISVVITLAVIYFLNPGIKKFFNYLSPDKEVSGFFARLTTSVLFLGGLSGAFAAHYDTGEKSNWLTMTWDSAGQFKESLQQLFIALIILSVTFSILLVIDKRINK